MTAPDRWRMFADVAARVRDAFPGSVHLEIARRWVMRAPEQPWRDCPVCGQHTPDALSLPKQHEVDRIVGATSDWEENMLVALGPSPGFGDPDALRIWTARRREVAVAEIPDLAFRSADWSRHPRELTAFRNRIGERWFCGGCVRAVAETMQPSHPALTPDRVFADLRRALGDGRLFDALEAARGSSTIPAVANRACGFCRATNPESFVLPWFRICRRCALDAANASG